MQIQSTGQAQSLAQMQQTQTQNQVRKMDGSGNGQGLQDGSNRTAVQTASATLQTEAPLVDNSTFSTFA